MPSYNLTVPVSSPFIRYRSGIWSFSQEAALCGTPNWAVDVAFEGTGIFLYGEIDYALDSSASTGQLSIILDGTSMEPPISNGLDNVIYTKEGLTPGYHILQLNRTGQSYQGPQLTGVNITTGDGDASTTTQLSRIEDQDTNITTHGQNSAGLGVFDCPPTFCSGGSALWVGGNGLANISFYGNDIAVYGFYHDRLDIQPGYNVSLDGQPAGSWPALTNVTESLLGVLLYQSGNLTLGSHYVLIQPDSTSALDTIAVDYADVRTYVDASTKSSSTATSTTTFTSSTRSESTPTGVIVGGVLGGLALIGVAIACAFFLIRRRFRRTRFTFVGEDGIDGGDPPTRSEEDMPPPDYQRVFAHESAATGPHVQAPGQQGRRDGHPSAFGRLFFSGKRQRHLAPPLTVMSGPQHCLINVAEANPDQPVLARREQPPTNNGERNWKRARGKK